MRPNRKLAGREPVRYAPTMQLPFSLPDWAPPWLGFVIIVVGTLFVLAFLAMPFSVFGIKGRLDGLEARLDELHREVRGLTLRLPEPPRVSAEQMDYEPDIPERRRWAEQPSRPPIPPRAMEADRPAPPPTRRVQAMRQSRPDARSEPRFDPD
jgi:hypothetical protein